MITIKKEITCSNCGALVKHVYSNTMLSFNAVNFTAVCSNCMNKKGTLIMETVIDKRQVMERLALKASTCTECALSKHRKTVVFGSGDPNSPMLLLGEGPGASEDDCGIPFSGVSGKLLDECLLANKIPRSKVYTCNIIRCRAQDLQGSYAKNRPPTEDEVASCAHWLHETITIVQPRVIVCIGAPAANSIIGKGFRIMSQRSQFYECSYADYAIATLHPAFILRQEGEAFDVYKAGLISDLALARKMVIKIRDKPRKITV